MSAKLEAYGEAFLNVIYEHCHAKPQAEIQRDTVSESINLFRLGMNAAGIASQRELTETTVQNHLAQGVEEGVIQLEELINLDDAQVGAIQDAFLASEQDSWPLKPVFEQFDESYDYPTLSYVRAALRAQAEA